MAWKLQELQDSALRLLSVDGLGGRTLSTLVRRAGGIEEAAEAILLGDALQWLPNGASAVLKERMERLEVDALRWSAEAINASIVTVMDDDFPKLLCPLPACPAVLWYRGTLNCVHSPSVAIVGARRCTKYGIEQADIFSTEITKANVLVISGGARGIDAAAHRSTIRNNGDTVAVMGSGLGVAYPPEHAPLFDEIVKEGGAVISEFHCTRPPRAAYFPRRNRIVSGLSSVVLVIEAARRSGALITARIAVEEHGRQCFVVPGRIGDSASAGCLETIRDGWVGIAVHPADIIEEAITAWDRFSAASKNAVHL